MAVQNRVTCRYKKEDTDILCHLVDLLSWMDNGMNEQEKVFLFPTIQQTMLNITIKFQMQIKIKKMSLR